MTPVNAPVGTSLEDLAANTIRVLSMEAVQKANSGHPGLPMGCAEIAYVLFTRFLKFDPRDPDWPDRDRFVLSAGHGSMLLYVMLHLTGYDLPLEEIALVTGDEGGRRRHQPSVGMFRPGAGVSWCGHLVVTALVRV